MRSLQRCRPARAPVYREGDCYALDPYDDELDLARWKLAKFEVIAGIEVRALLGALDMDHVDRRLAELGPPLKSKRLNRQGRTLKITTELLIRASCGINSPLANKSKLQGYLRNGETTRLRRRLEADAKALHAYYQYGRLHGAVRLRWGFLDEMIPAPWVHRDEMLLGDLKSRACDQDLPMEVATGSAPGWAEPLSRARLCRVEKDARGWGHVLLNQEGLPIDEREVQAARIVQGQRVGCRRPVRRRECRCSMPS